MAAISPRHGPYHRPLAMYQRRSKTDSVVVHCAMTSRHQRIRMADIRGWHINERKWMDTGYHFFIDFDGSLELGRPWWAVGAGVAGWNGDSIHICLEGGSDERGNEQNNFTPQQWRTLYALIVTLREMDPGAERVIGHREYPGVKKYCPSFDVGTWLKSVGLARVE